jgi:predicted dienelactone hydrolase
MKRFACACLLAAVPLVAADRGIHTSIAGRDVAVWMPAGAAPVGGFPLVVFSHGFGGCNTQSVFLMESLANAGYLVVAPDHADAGCGKAPESRFGGRHPEEPFQKAEEWSDATYKDRLADVKAVLDAALSAKSFQGVRVDANRVGIAGHSLGGYTALGIAGAWPSWKDARVKAVLALSPYTEPFVAKGNLAHMQVPVMFQGGTLDFGVSPVVRRPGGTYDRSSGPKYYVEFQGAGHLAWTGLNPHFHDMIDRYSVAFFDRYLKADTSGDQLAALFEHARSSGVSLLRSSLK